jgi:hypothetical protein
VNRERSLLVAAPLVLPASLAAAQAPDLQLKPLPAPDIAGAVVSGAAGGASSITLRRYVETGALLQALLNGGEALQPELSGEGLVTSALTFVEAARAISRARREKRLDAREAREAERQLAAFERSCDVVSLGEHRGPGPRGRGGAGVRRRPVTSSPPDRLIPDLWFSTEKGHGPDW